MKESHQKLPRAIAQQLKARAHALKPVIMIGSKGLTEMVRLETDKALQAHELIKVKISAPDRESFIALAQALSDQCHAFLIHTIGRIAILYRKTAEK